jgi:hypothetical protein
MKWEETTDRMKATFGLASDDMMAKAKDLSLKTGSLFSTGDIANALVKTSDQLERFGFTDSETMNLVGVATNIAAQRHMELSEVMDKLERSMEGNARGARSLGLTISDNYMKYSAFGGTLKDVWGYLTENEKAHYRLEVVQQESSKYSDVAAEKATKLSGAYDALTNKIKALIVEGNRIPLLPMGTDLPGGTDTLYLANDQKKKEESKNLVDTELGPMSDLLANINNLQDAHIKWLEKVDDKAGQLKQNLADQQQLQGGINKMEQERAAIVQKIAEINNRPPEEVEWKTNSAWGTGVMHEVDQSYLKTPDTTGLAEAEGIYAKITKDIEDANARMDQLRAKQQQFDQDKLNRLKDEMWKNTGTLGGMDDAVFNKDMSSVMDMRTTAESKINGLLSQQYDIQKKIDASEAGSPERSALQDQLAKVNERIQGEQGIVDNITNEIKKFRDQFEKLTNEQVNRNTDKMDEFATKLNTINAMEMHPDTAPMQKSLDDINAALEKANKTSREVAQSLQEWLPKAQGVFSGQSAYEWDNNVSNANPPAKKEQGVFAGQSAYDWDYGISSTDRLADATKAAVDKAKDRLNEFDTDIFKDRPVVIDFMGSGSSELPLSEKIAELMGKYNQMYQDFQQGATFNLDCSGASQEIDNLIDKAESLKEIMQQGGDYTMNMYMAMSPAQPFSTGYQQLLSKLAAIPNDSTFTIKMQSVYDQYQKLEYLANPNISAYQKGWGYGADVGGQNTQATLLSAAQQQLALLTPTYDAMMAEYNYKMQQYQASTTSVSSSTSSSGSGITVSMGTTIININGGSASGSTRDLAVTLSDRMDEELAGKIIGQRSKIVDALKKAGVIH